MLKFECLDRKRFMNVCRKGLIENWRSYVLRFLLMYGVMTVVFLWSGYLIYDSYRYTLPGDQDFCQLGVIAFMWFLFIFGMLDASFTMESMKSKTGRIALLMTPATSFEKYFSRWLISVVVFLIAFLIAYRLADYTRILVYTISYPEIKTIVPVDLGHLIGQNKLYYTPFETAIQFLNMFSFYLFLQSCFILGSSIWPKNAFVKTFVACGLILMIYLSTIWVMSRFIKAHHSYRSFGFDWSDQTCYTLLLSILLIGTLFNWIMAYYRFKESEVIHRM